MDKSSLLAKSLPHVIAVIIFLAISIFMYRPIIFEGKVMDQNDINQGKGANQEIVEFREGTGEEALWTNSMFGGMPAYLINVRWSGGSILWNTQKAFTFFLPQPIGENFLAFLCFYILCLVFGIRPQLAIVGALAFGLSTFYLISIQAGHIWKIRAIAYMPAVIAGVKLVFEKKYISGFLLTAFSVAYIINTNHLQITYYLVLLLGGYGISEMIYAMKARQFNELAQKIGILVLAAILGVGANFGKIWTTYEYGKYSIRGKSELSTTSSSSQGGLDKDYVFRWSNEKWETMMLFIPHIYGGASGVFDGNNSEVEKLLSRNNVPANEIDQIERVYLGYWGNLPGTAGPAYAGAAVCFLFVLSLFFLDKRTKYWMLAIIVFSIMLSWGKNFPALNNLMFDVFPGYNKFRAVTMVIILALTLMPLMGTLALERISSLQWDKTVSKQLFISLGITIGIALFAWAVTNPPVVEGIQKTIAEAIESDRKDIIKKDIFRSILYVILAFGGIFFFLKGKIGTLGFSGIMALIILLDLGLVSSRYLNDSVYKRPEDKSFLSETPADTKILQDEELGYRVLNLQDPFNEARTSYFHHSLGGYHGAKLRRYQDLISNHLVPEMQQIIQDKGINASNSSVISMLNTKYLLAGYQENAVIRNPYQNGAAWIVDEIQTVSSPDEEIKRIGEVDLASVAVIDQSMFSAPKISVDSTATITLIDHQPNKVQYEASTGTKSLAVFSEIFYPKGWRAFVDDKEVEIMRANYVLRALELPEGQHKIEFRFEPQSYFIGNTIMWVSTIILILLLIILPGKKLILKSN